MGVFDSYLDEKPTSGKKATSGGVFDSYLGETVTEEPQIETPSKPPVSFSRPSPTARKPFGASPSGAMDEFTSDISSGDFAVSGTPTPKPKKNVPDKVTRGYDTAIDKFKFKQTLSNTELARLDQTRPEHRDFGSKQIGNAEVRASSFPSIQNADTAISQDTTANTLFELGEQNLVEPNLLDAVQNTARYVPQKWRGIKKEVLEPTVGKSLYETIHGVSMDDSFNVKKKLDKGQQTLRGARAIVDTVFAPLSVISHETSNQEDPSIYGGIGNVANRFVMLPFEAAASSISNIGQTVGMEKETADDLGIVVAAFAPLIRRMRKDGASTKEISTVVDRANQTFTKIRDLDKESKKLYRR